MSIPCAFSTEGRCFPHALPLCETDCLAICSCRLTACQPVPHSPPLLPSDLYIPVMALWTYCLLLGVAALARSGPTGGFKPETIYNSVRWLFPRLCPLEGQPGRMAPNAAPYCGTALLWRCRTVHEGPM